MALCHASGAPMGVRRRERNTQTGTQLRTGAEYGCTRAPMNPAQLFTSVAVGGCFEHDGLRLQPPRADSPDSRFGANGCRRSRQAWIRAFGPAWLGARRPLCPTLYDDGIRTAAAFLCASAIPQPEERPWRSSVPAAEPRLIERSRAHPAPRLDERASRQSAAAPGCRRACECTAKDPRAVARGAQERRKS